MTLIFLDPIFFWTRKFASSGRKNVTHRFFDPTCVCLGRRRLHTFFSFRKLASSILWGGKQSKDQFCSAVLTSHTKSSQCADVKCPHRSVQCVTLYCVSLISSNPCRVVRGVEHSMKAGHDTMYRGTISYLAHKKIHPP